jgi:hypothetical protein
MIHWELAADSPDVPVQLLCGRQPEIRNRLIRAATEGIADGQVSRQVHMVHLGGGITGSGKGKCGVMWI